MNILTCWRYQARIKTYWLKAVRSSFCLLLTLCWGVGRFWGLYILPSVLGQCWDKALDGDDTLPSNIAQKSVFTRRCAVIFQQHSKQGVQRSSYEANNFVYFCQQLSTLGNIDKGYHRCPLHTAFRLLTPSVSLLLGFLSGEQPQLTGCGLCRRRCHWLWARACVIFCGTFASSTLDSAWDS